jgi:hypothetical protein
MALLCARARRLVRGSGTPALKQQQENFQMSTDVVLPAPCSDEWLAAKTNGIIFEFKSLEQARAFAAEVERRYKLAGRVTRSRGFKTLRLCTSIVHFGLCPWIRRLKRRLKPNTRSKDWQ